MHCPYCTSEISDAALVCPVCTRDLYDTLEQKSLPRHELIMGEIPGRSGALALQGKDFLA